MKKVRKQSVSKNRPEKPFVIKVTFYKLIMYKDTFMVHFGYLLDSFCVHCMYFGYVAMSS